MTSHSIALTAAVLVVCPLACGGPKQSGGYGEPSAFDTNPNGSNSNTNNPNQPGSSQPTGNLGGSDAGTTVMVNLDGGCATATAMATREPVYMLFVLDGSFSMTMQNKWTSVVPALDSIFQSFQMQADPNFGAGLIVFSDTNDSTYGFGPYPSGADVPIAFVDSTQYNALRARIDNSQPSDGTPTYAALSGGWSELEGFTATAPLNPNGKKVLILLTDGVPTDGSNQMCISSAATELMKSGPAGPITTFAVGVGDFPSTSPHDFDPSFLGALAQAGGAAPAGCNPSENSNVSNVCYFEIDPSTAPSVAQLTQQFVAAINQIQGQVSSCTFALQSTNSGTIDPTKVNVVVTDGGTQTTISQDPVNGWSYDDPNAPTEVILNGTACMNLMSDPSATISIVLGCETQVAQSQ